MKCGLVQSAKLCLRAALQLKAILSSVLEVLPIRCFCVNATRFRDDVPWSCGQVAAAATRYVKLRERWANL